MIGTKLETEDADVYFIHVVEERCIRDEAGARATVNWIQVTMQA